MNQSDLSVELYVYEYLKKNYKDVAKVFKKHVASKLDSSELPSLQHIIESYHQQNDSQPSQTTNGSLSGNQAISKKKDLNIKSKEGEFWFNQNLLNKFFLFFFLVRSNSTSKLGKKSNNKAINSKDSSSDSSDDISNLMNKKPTTVIDKAIMNIKNKPLHVPSQTKENAFNAIISDSESDNLEEQVKQDEKNEKIEGNFKIEWKLD